MTVICPTVTVYSAPINVSTKTILISNGTYTGTIPAGDSLITGITITGSPHTICPVPN